MTVVSGILLFLSAIIGGGLNAVAGGGSFITYPTLIFSGVPLIPANATSTIALWPGALASIAPYRDTLVSQRRALVSLTAISMTGGLLGAIALLHTPQQLFKYILPYLLLFATLIFAFGGTITKFIRQWLGERGSASSPWTLAGLAILQFIIAFYGGFFGGGIGILMLALFALMEMKDIHTMNALKVLLAACINGIAVIAFILAGKIFWGQALVMIFGAILGGYYGATIARRIPQRYLRIFVMTVGFSISAYFFLRA